MQDRKKDHIDLSLTSKSSHSSSDNRFFYEPILSGNDTSRGPSEKMFLGKKFKVPMWVSSMTGGTSLAKKINQNLARLCKEFGMGMGLGSCRSILESDKFLLDFDVRNIIGSDCPLFANLGIAQIEDIVSREKYHILENLIKKLDADGLVIHINPLQEFLQPEGDIITQSPLTLIEKILENFDGPLIIKEVGQGFGPKSMRALLSLPLAAIELAGYGGTNFSVVEEKRARSTSDSNLSPFCNIGHNCEQMIDYINYYTENFKDDIKCSEIIISGGISNFLDGYHLMAKCSLNSIFGMASTFLKYAMEDYGSLHKFMLSQYNGLTLAQNLLIPRV